MHLKQQSSFWQRLDVSVGAGLLAGCGYTVVDVYLDHVLESKLQPSTHPLQLFHAVIDLVLPIVTGALLGLVLYSTRLRQRIAVLERRRADDLAGHLHKVERDQAVWVISASLLHEFKNPLHTLGLLLDELAELPDGSARVRAALIERARAQSVKLEERLLNLRSLEHERPLELPHVELTGFIRDQLVLLIPLAERRQLGVELKGEPTWAFAHPTYLRIILDNLLENALDALRTSARSNQLHIQVFSDEDFARVRIHDNGPGLPRELSAHIFEPLVTQKSTGLGLGLAIARGLARAMGGDLHLVPSSHGACFELRLKGAER